GSVSASHAAGLIVGRVGARGELPVAALARQPGLAVVLLRRRGPEVAGGDVDHAVRDPERAQELFLDPEQALVLGLRLLGEHEREHLYLVELVDAKDASRVPARGAGFAAKAGGEARVTQGQVALPQYLLGVERCEAYLGG